MPTNPKTFISICGMPRSGSTILGNILAQNPQFYVGPTSALVEILTTMRSGFEKIAEFRAAPNEEAMMGSLRGALFGFFEPVKQPVVFDRSRSWLFELEMLEVLLRGKAKVLVPVRDITEILVSFERLWRDNKAYRTLAQQEASPVEFRSLEGRCNVWLQPAAPVGRPYVAIQDALTRGFRDRMHFIHFDDLSRNPAAEMQKIYNFLELPPFPHDFENVQQVIIEDDLVYGIKGLHDIRKAVRPIPKRANQELGALVEKFKGPYAWDPYLAKEKC